MKNLGNLQELDLQDIVLQTISWDIDSNSWDMASRLLGIEGNFRNEGRPTENHQGELGSLFKYYYDIYWPHTFNHQCMK